MDCQKFVLGDFRGIAEQLSGIPFNSMGESKDFRDI